MEEKFDNDVELIDFERESAHWARNYVNNWVESKTDGQIKDVLQELSPSSTATLVSIEKRHNKIIMFDFTSVFNYME